MSYPYGGIDTVTLGVGAGATGQSALAIAFGKNAGNVNQGANSIAIGNLAGYNAHGASSIVISALGSTMTTTTANSFYVAPIRNLSTISLLQYNPNTMEITYANQMTSTFTVASQFTTSSFTTVNGGFSTMTGSFMSVSTMNATAAIGIGTAANASQLQIYNGAATYMSAPTVSISEAAADVSALYNGMLHLTRPAAATDNKAHIVFARPGSQYFNMGFFQGTSNFGITAGYTMAGYVGMAFNVSGTNVNVGIGTATANQPLTIYSPSGGNALSISTPATKTNYMSFYSGTTAYGLIGFDNNVGVGLFGSGSAYGFCVGTQQATSLSLCTSNAVRMTITSGGNVGIGTNTTSYTLHVVGTFQVLGNANTNVYSDFIYFNVRAADSLNGDGNMVVYSNSINLKAGDLTWGSSTRSYGSQIYIGGGYSEYGGINHSDIKMYTSNAVRMTITSGGNVGIGITNSSQHLFINTPNAIFRIGQIGFLGTQNGVYNGVASMNSIVFTTYRDANVTDRFGAKIVGINKNSYSQGAYGLVQSTDLAFYTVPFNTPDAQDQTIERMRITDGGNVGIGIINPSYTLHVIGTIYASGDITALSDQRYKTDLHIVDHALDKLLSLHGYSYVRMDQENKKRHLGLLAQQVQTVFPEAVNYDEKNDQYSLNYGCMIAPLIEAMREMCAEIRELRAMIEKQ